jgi:hypothetical protein
MKATDNELKLIKKIKINLNNILPTMITLLVLGMEKN